MPSADRSHTGGFENVIIYAECVKTIFKNYTPNPNE